jgi:hypothetical protein
MTKMCDLNYLESNDRGSSVHSEYVSTAEITGLVGYKPRGRIDEKLLSFFKDAPINHPPDIQVGKFNNSNSIKIADMTQDNLIQS